MTVTLTFPAQLVVPYIPCTQSKQQVEVRVQKAVEANSKQAQKALDAAKKKAEADIAKV